MYQNVRSAPEIYLTRCLWRKKKKWVISADWMICEHFPLQLELTCQRDESFHCWRNWNSAHNAVANTKRAKLNYNMLQNICSDCYIFSLLSSYDRMSFSSPRVVSSFCVTYAKVQHSVLPIMVSLPLFFWTTPDFLSVMILSDSFNFSLCCGWNIWPPKGVLVDEKTKPCSWWRDSENKIK